MLFNSIDYFIFLFISLALYYLIPVKFRWILLLISSIVFYCIGGLKNIYVPIAIILVTYFSGIYISKLKGEKTKKALLYFGIIFNTGLLFFFKYTNFLISNIIEVAGHVNKHSTASASADTNLISGIAVPLGISFITFQAIGYLVDVYWGKMQVEKHIGFFSTYIFFFPKVISGPVERAQALIPQLKINKSIDYDIIVEGLKRIVWGLFKKLVIANRLAIYTEAVFNNYSQHTGLTLFVASILYTIQLYADFSGYTDIALGSAGLFGYKLSENFNKPLFALSMTEFWRKWHITLTSWVTDYIFNPIVTKRRYWNKWGIVYSTIITFLILGLWHGANWTFIMFGFLNGIIVSIEFLSKKIRKKLWGKSSLYLKSVFGIIYTILFFSFTMIFFKSNNINDSFDIIGKIGHFDGLSLNFGITSSTLKNGFLGIAFLIFELNQEFSFSKIKLFNNPKWFIQQLCYAGLIIIILLFGVFDGGQFIYYKF